MDMSELFGFCERQFPLGSVSKDENVHVKAEPIKVLQEHWFREALKELAMINQELIIRFAGNDCVEIKIGEFINSPGCE